MGGQKSSSVLHSKLHQICQAQGIIPSSIESVLYVAGPGFYTGLRIAYGIAEILRIDDKPSLSFYNYEVPYFLGVQDYTWITKAYRGEVFIHQRRGNDAFNRLVTEKDFLSQNWQGKVFIHHQQALDVQMSEKLAGALETQTMMLAGIATIWQSLKQDSIVRDLHYFRPAEEEFKPNP